MGQREVFQALAENSLSRCPGLPRLGTNPLMRTRKFISSSKTPKISNRAVHSQSAPSSGLKLFVTEQYRRLAPYHSVKADRSISTRKGNAIVHARLCQRQSRDISSHKQDLKLLHLEAQSSDEDMDLCSDSGDLSLEDSSSTSPEGSPPSATVLHFQPTPIEMRQRQRNTIKNPNLSSFMPNRGTLIHLTSDRPFTSTENCAERFSHRNNRFIDYPFHPEMTDGLFNAVWENPADDPTTLFQLLYGANTPLGTEIGGEELQQESLDGSEITVPTILGMPSFPPRDAQLPSAKSLEIDYVDDMIEEWSLPDEEANTVIIFELDGKEYIHDPLPPGWIMKISKTRKRPFYLHPDHGITWHCPISLKPKSKALVLRKSSLMSKKKEDDILRLASHVNDVSPTPLPYSLEGSMSELIHQYNHPKITDGYDGSVSSTCSTDSETTLKPECSTTLAHQSKTNKEEKPDWETPLRWDIVTPTNKPQKRLTVAMRSSTPTLSPILEDKGATGRKYQCPEEASDKTRFHVPNDRYESTMSSTHISEKLTLPTSSELATINGRFVGKRSTPRVSFEPVEVADNSKALPSPENTNPERPAEAFPSDTKTPLKILSLASPIPKKNLMNTSTPISDTDDTNEAVMFDSHQERVEVHSARPSSRNLCTPTEVSSARKSLLTVRHAPSKRKTLQLFPLSHTTPPLRGTRPPKVPRTGGRTSILKSGTKSPLNFIRTSSSENQDDKITSSNKKTSEDGDTSDMDCLIPQQVSLLKTKNLQHDECPEGVVATVDDSASTPRELSPIMREQETVRHQTDRIPTSDFFSVEGGVDDGDNWSSPAQHNCATPKDPSKTSWSDGSHVLLSVQSNRSISQSSHGKHSSPSHSTVPTHLSYNVQDRSPIDSIQGQLDDHYESDNLLSPPDPKRKARPFNWRVTYPFHPICALQRLDILLVQQQKYGGKETKKKEVRVVQKRKGVAKESNPIIQKKHTRTRFRARTVIARSKSASSTLFHN